jgi:hypothetical protein
MLTIESRFFVAGVCGREITDFLLDCTDDRYKAVVAGYPPGAACAVPPSPSRRRHCADGQIRREASGADAGRRRSRRAGSEDRLAAEGVRLPVWLTLELADRDGGVDLRHMITAPRRWASPRPAAVALLLYRVRSRDGRARQDTIPALAGPPRRDSPGILISAGDR